MKVDAGIAIEECASVYPPSEDTYLMLDCLEVRPGDRVLEMGCGTGILALHCAKAGAIVSAADINPKAVDCARANAKSNRLEMSVVQSDLFLDVEGVFDLVIFNPPYVPDEIRGDIERSWAGGEDGVRVLERFLKDTPDHLREGGRIVVLLSTAMEDAALQCVLSQFVRDRLGARRLFFESIWVESLRLP
ncbi:MAG: methyltransferase [Methanomassiliicoccales archaeon]|nr:methyltransferase [Methanomassiliicoccales archaeon]